MLLTRRQIREKVMKTLYAYYQGAHTEVSSAEKELLHSISKVYEVFIYYMKLLPELKHFAEQYVIERKNKRLPSQEDLDPSLNFVNNTILLALSESSELHEITSKMKIGWDDQPDLIKKIYFSFKDESFFKKYLAKEKLDFEDESTMLVELVERFIVPNEAIINLFEERSLYWLDEIELMQQHFLKFIIDMKEPRLKKIKIPTLHKFKEEDLEFATKLFRRTLLSDKEYLAIIALKTDNWEIERVAKMDIILMQMAICELLQFPSIPIKVSLDEYIEISKEYSSPQSKIFINGILDKLVTDFKRDNKIQKAGRGLIE
jgi:N utilization substance protein B